MERVAYDSEGYAYSVDSGLYLNIAWDANGQPFDAETGNPVQIVRYDPASPSGGSDHFEDVTGAVRDTLVAIFGNQYQQPRSSVPAGYLPTSVISPRATGLPSQGGVGFNISTNTLIFIAGGVLLFMVGMQRGRR